MRARIASLTIAVFALAGAAASAVPAAAIHYNSGPSGSIHYNS